MKNGKDPRPEPQVIKRFYKTVTVEDTPAGWRIMLDGRGVRTPKRAPLALPSKALAERVAAEWRAQGDAIQPHTMPLTKLANTTLDGVIGREDAVRDEVAAYAGSDLLCYRAERPRELVRRQQELWDPLLAWARQAIGVELKATSGVMPIAQPQESRERVRAAIGRLDPFALAACHVMTTLTGSAVLALAFIAGRLTVQEAWSAAHLDEDFQNANWGEDWEARQRREFRHAEMTAAAIFYEASRG